MKSARVFDFSTSRRKIASNRTYYWLPWSAPGCCVGLFTHLSTTGCPIISFGKLIFRRPLFSPSCGGFIRNGFPTVKSASIRAASISNSLAAYTPVWPRVGRSAASRPTAKHRVGSSLGGLLSLLHMHQLQKVAREFGYKHWPDTLSLGTHERITIFTHSFSASVVSCWDDRQSANFSSA